MCTCKQQKIYELISTREQQHRTHSCTECECKKHILAKKLSSAASENVKEKSG